MENNKKLDGVWKNGAFNVKIKGDTYVSYYNNFRYGKGKIIFDNEKFTLTSTHARWLIFWIPFVEVVEGKYFVEVFKGKYFYANDKLIVSGIEGRYSDYNGTWTFEKNISSKKKGQIIDDVLKKEIIEKLSQEDWSNEEITNVINRSYNINLPPPKEREAIVKLSKRNWNNEEIAMTFNISKAEVELILEIYEKL